jgi:hypothetical protein
MAAGPLRPYHPQLMKARGGIDHPQPIKVRTGQDTSLLVAFYDRQEQPMVYSNPDQQGKNIIIIKKK